MNNMLAKVRNAVGMTSVSDRFSKPVVEDVRSATLSFRTYKYVLFVVAIAAFYYAFLASDRYVTTADVFVKSTGGGNTLVPQLALLGGGGGGDKDTLLVNAYVGSQDLLNLLEEKIGVYEHFSSDEWDFYARLGKDPTEEARLKYFKKRLYTGMNPDTGVISIKAQAFTPEFSLKMLQETIKASEIFINSIGQKIALEEIAFVELEMVRARENLKSAQAKLLRFQNENGILSAEVAGASRQAMVNELENRLVRRRTEEKTLSSYLNENAAEMVAVRGRIDALTAQLEIERERLASQDGLSVNDVNAAYRELELEVKFASDLYQSSLITLEGARVESYKKLKHLILVESPKLADEALEPRKLYNLLSLFVALTLAYGIITMVIATIREHRDV